MWNYEEVDKYITLKDLSLLMQWFEQVDKKTSGSYMLTSIERSGDEYTVHLSIAQNGYFMRFKIADGVVTHLGNDGFWMS